MNSFPNFNRSEIIWKILNFKPDLLHNDDFYFSCSPEFELILSPSNRTTTVSFMIMRLQSCLSLYLKFKDFRHDRKVGFSISLLGSYRNKLCSSGVAEQLEYRPRLGRVINYKEAIRDEKTYFRNNTMTLSVRLEITERVADVRIPATIKTITTQFENLFKDEKFSDFKLVTVDGTVVPVHKNILSTRSPVFERMIQTNMLESEENKCTISDIGERAMLEFLHFIYCGTVTNLDDVAEELLYASTKYDVPDLKPLCVESLASKLSSSNVFEILMLADLHDSPNGKLKGFCIDFIKWNYLELQQNEEGWKNLPQSLYKDILDAVLCNLKLDSLKITSSIVLSRDAAVNVSIPLENEEDYLTSATMDAENPPSYKTINRPQRSLPIPKEVNNFILRNYGALYYLSTSSTERTQILQAIEQQLKTAGYKISWQEVERRLKNMKSHYRRKQNDLRMGCTKSVEWEYYEALDNIFGPGDLLSSEGSNHVESDDQKIEAKPKKQPEKRKMNNEEYQEQTKKDDETQPEDLSVKRPKLIEFTYKEDLTSQIQAPPAETSNGIIPKEDLSAIDIFRKVVETFKSLDEQRCALDQQRLALEIRRHELDSIGFQLSIMLQKLIYPPPTQTEM